MLVKLPPSTSNFFTSFIPTWPKPFIVYNAHLHSFILQEFYYSVCLEQVIPNAHKQMKHVKLSLLSTQTQLERSLKKRKQKECKVQKMGKDSCEMFTSEHEIDGEHVIHHCLESVVI